MTLPGTGKLVRDGIPDLIRESGSTPAIEVLSPDDHVAALHLKLAEEASELADALPEHQAEELADLLEVLRGLSAALGVPWEHVETAVAEKRLARGGFDQAIWLLNV